MLDGELKSGYASESTQKEHEKARIEGPRPACILYSRFHRELIQKVY